MIDELSAAFAIIAGLAALKTKTPISYFVFIYFALWIFIESVLYLNDVHPFFHDDPNRTILISYLLINLAYQYAAIDALSRIKSSILPVCALGFMLLYSSANIFTEFFGITLMSSYIYAAGTLAWIALLIEGFIGGGTRINHGDSSGIHHRQGISPVKVFVKKI